MKAVIRAAGLGKRLRPITNTLPKALVEIQKIPVIFHVLNSLPSKINEIIIVVGYKGDLIKEKVGNKFGEININYVTQETQDGSFNALLCAKNYIEDKFLVVNCDDLILKNDLEKLLEFEFSALVADHKMEFPFGICVADKDNKLISISEKPVYTNTIMAGPYVLPKEIMDIEIEAGPNSEYNLPVAVNKLARTKPCIVVKASRHETMNTVLDHEKLNTK